jgi:hypothetical protein
MLPDERAMRDIFRRAGFAEISITDGEGIYLMRARRTGEERGGS